MHKELLDLCPKSDKTRSKQHGTWKTRLYKMHARYIMIGCYCDIGNRNVDIWHTQSDRLNGTIELQCSVAQLRPIRIDRGGRSKVATRRTSSKRMFIYGREFSFTWCALSLSLLRHPLSTSASSRLALYNTTKNTLITRINCYSSKTATIIQAELQHLATNYEQI